MSATIKRKTTIRTAAAIRAAMPAFGIAEGDKHGTALTVSEDGSTTSLTSAKLPGSSATPVAFDLTGAAVVYPTESDVAVCELLAQATAEQMREVARLQGHAVSTSEEVVWGRGVIRLVVEQPPRKLTIDVDRAGKEVSIVNQGFATPKEGRAFARPYEAVFY